MTKVENNLNNQLIAEHDPADLGFHDSLLIPHSKSDTHLKFREAVRRGLSGNPRTLPCKYFYDAQGSRLFDQICELEEYYLTRTERGILERNLEEICALCGKNCLLVELGSGSSSKTRLLLDHLPCLV